MQKFHFLWIVSLFAMFFVFQACSTTNYTNRSQLMLMSQEEEAKLGAQSANEILKNSKVIKNTKDSKRVQDVSTRIAKATNRSDFEWEFYLIEGKEVNAFCLPGGKIFVYTGLLKLVDNDDELATVIGHEVAHALLRHGAERSSMQTIQQMGGNVLGLIISGAAPEYSSVFNLAYGVGSNVGVMLPFSRSHELEADEVGIVLMQRAGYDPKYALSFWQKMAQTSSGSQMEFLSTHPSDEKRIAQIKEILKKIK